MSSAGASTIPLLPPPPSKTQVTSSRPGSNKLKNDALSLGQVQNTKNARVYVFGETDLAEEEVNNQNNFELRPRGKQKLQHTPNHSDHQTNEVIFLEREIKDGDTLEKFALQYGCSVAELKQSNKIGTNQEFFALRTIKIPVKKYGLLTETEEERKRRAWSESEVTSPTGSYHSINAESDDSDVHYKTLSIGRSFDDCKEGNEFLKVMDKDLKKIAKSTKTSKESLEEVVSVLNGKSIHPMHFPNHKQTETQWSTWRTLLLVIGGVVLVSAVVVFILRDYWS